MARAKRLGSRAARRTFRVWLLAVPHELTPERAERWMRTTFPRLSDFAGLGFYPHALRPERQRDELRAVLATLAREANVLARACAEAIASGRTVEIERGGRFPIHAGTLRKLRAVLAFEAREPHGVRTVLRRTLALAERDARRAKAAA